eukprot:s2453_g19.t1
MPDFIALQKAHDLEYEVALDMLQFDGFAIAPIARSSCLSPILRSQSQRKTNRHVTFGKAFYYYYAFDDEKPMTASHDFLNQVDWVDCAPLSLAAVLSCPSVENGFADSVRTNFIDMIRVHEHCLALNQNCSFDKGGQQMANQESDVRNHDIRAVSAIEDVSPSTDASPQQTYSDMPSWMSRLLQIGEESLADDQNQPIPAFPVMTWYIDHVDSHICAQPKLVNLGPDQEEWENELKFPWLPDIPFRERVFLDVVWPNTPRYSFETHLADVILTTKPVQVSALVAVRINRGPDDMFEDEPFLQLLKRAVMLGHELDFPNLKTRISDIDDISSAGFRFSHDGIDQDQFHLHVYDGMCLIFNAERPEMPAEAQESDMNVLIDITNLPETHETRSPLTRTNISHGPKPGGAPLSHEAVLSSQDWSHEHGDHVFAMQLSNGPFPSQAKNTPHDDQQSVMMSAFARGHADPDFAGPVYEENDDLAESDLGHDDSQSVATTGSGVHPPSSDAARQDVVMFHLRDDPLRAFLDWSGYRQMIREIAFHFSTNPANVVDAYEINTQIGGLPPDSVPIIVHLFPDIAVGQAARLTLFDVELHGHRSEASFKLGPTTTRSVLVTPESCTRDDILTLSNVDQYCRREGGRCLVWHNSRPWRDYDGESRRIDHGDHFRLAIPPTERFQCPTSQTVSWTQEGLSDDEILELTLHDQAMDGYSPSMLDPEEVRALARHATSEEEEDFQALQLDAVLHGGLLHVAPQAKTSPDDAEHSSIDMSATRGPLTDKPCPVKCSFTDEFVAFVDAANNVPEDAPEFPDEQSDIASQSVFVQDLWEKWTDHATLGPGNVELMAKIETWFTDHVSLQRCMIPREVVLTREYGDWERQILLAWMDVAAPFAETSYHLVYPKPEDASPSVFAQVVVIQHPLEDLRSLVLSVYDSSRELQRPFSFCQVMHHRIGIEEVLDTTGLTEVCTPSLPQNECSLWYGTTPIRDGQKVFVRSGYALRLSVRRGTLISYQSLMALSDAQLRAQLQSSPHVAVYSRPSWPRFSGDVYAFHDQEFHANPPAEIVDHTPSSSSAALPGSHDLPDWILSLRRIFSQQARVDNQWDGPFIDILVWYLNGRTAESCRVPRVGNQIAFVVPRRMSATDVRSAMASSLLSTSRNAVWRANLRFEDDQRIEIHHGDGLVIEPESFECLNPAPEISEVASEEPDEHEEGMHVHVSEPEDPAQEDDQPSFLQNSWAHRAAEDTVDVTLKSDEFDPDEKDLLPTQEVAGPKATLSSIDSDISVPIHWNCQQAQSFSEVQTVSDAIPIELDKLLAEYQSWVHRKIDCSSFIASDQVIGESRAISIELVTGRTLSILVSSDVSMDTLKSTVAKACDLLDPMSEFCEIRFRRQCWAGPATSWWIASVRQPEPKMSIVMCLFCAEAGSRHLVRTFPQHVSEACIRQALNAKFGTRILHNGVPVSGHFDLLTGDVLEVSAVLSHPSLPDFSGRRVVISLEASVPIDQPIFQPDRSAWCFSEHESWNSGLSDSIGTKFVSLPEGLDLHAATFEALHLQDSVENHQPERIELFVDGSASQNRAGWAVVAVSVSTSGCVFQGCLAGTVTLNPRDPTWIGAKDLSNIDAELTAMAVAQNVGLQVSHAWPVVIRPDLQFSHQLAVQQATSQHSYVLPQLVHALGQLAGDGIAIHEIRGHVGNPWKELADKLANHAANCDSFFGWFDWSALRSLAMTEDNYKWAWLQSMNHAFQFAMPPVFENSVWQPHTSCLHAVPTPSPAPLVENAHFDFRIVTYNALSLCETSSARICRHRNIRVDKQFHDAGVAVACVQEARTPEGCRVTDHYKIFSSGRQQCGQSLHFGCEIWIHKSRPIGKCPNGRIVRLSDLQVTIVHNDPRILVMKMTGPCRIVVVSAHAPCLASYRGVEEIAQWWDKLASIVQPLMANDWVILGIDANAPLGHQISEGVGDFEAEDTSDVGDLFFDFIERCTLHVPSTFEGHAGQSASWRHPRGQWLRRDYLLVNRRIAQIVAESYALGSFDGGFEHEDHLPMAVRLAGCVQFEHGPSRRLWNFDKLADAECQKRFQRALASLPMPVWNTGVDTHARLLEGQIMQLAMQHFGDGGPRRRPRPVLSEATLNLIAFKRQILQMFRDHGDDPAGSIMAHIKEIDKMIRPLVARDQQQWYDSWLQDIQNSGEIHDHRAVFAKLSRLGRKRKTQASGPRPLPLLRHPDGHTAADFQESQRIFCDQFAQIEAGLEVHDNQLLQLHRPKAIVEDIDSSLCPSVFEVCKRIKSMKNRKAPGPGGMPVEVLKAGGSAVAKHIVPLLMKATLHQQEPLHWKGGTLIPLFKGKGSTSSAASYRSIFLSDCLAKVHHGNMRKCLADVWVASDDVIQFGGKKGYSTDLAHHLLGMHMTWGRQRNLSVGLLFVDLQAAFYSVLRGSFFADNVNDHLLCKGMQHFGITPADWHSIRQQVERDYALQGVGQHAEGILRDMFTATHFRMSNIPNAVCTTRGTRPGDPVADIMFNMLFRLVLLDTREMFQRISSLPWIGSPVSPADVTDPGEMPMQGFCDVSFVDDVAYSLHVHDPRALNHEMQCLASCLHDVARSRGLSINYSKGKTEAMLRHAGQGCRKERQKLWHDLEGTLPVITEQETSTLRVVHAYKHLGSFLQDLGVCTRDMKLRVAQARQAEGQLHRSFYAKTRISIEVRARVFHSLVSSRHLFQAHTWAWITDRDLEIWHSGLRSQIAGLVRQCIRPIPHFKFSTTQLYALAGLPGPSDELHANRLRYFGRILHSGPSSLWKLLHESHGQQSWPALLVSSFKWLCAHSPSFTPAFEDFSDVCSYVRLHEQWKGKIKTALKACVSFHKAEAEGLCWTLRTAHKISSWSDFAIKPKDAHAGSWICNQCDAKFSNKRALAMHSRQMHRYRRWQQYFALGVDCDACGKRYFSRCRLIAHLTTSTRCASSYRACFPPAPDAEVDLLEEADNAHARLLKSQGWLPSKAFHPVLRIPFASLPPAGSDGAVEMYAKWSVRNPSPGEGFDSLDGRFQHEADPGRKDDGIIPFVGQTYGGRVLGHSGVFQYGGLSSLHAEIFIQSLVFVHFYSGYRRPGDLQDQIEDHIVMENIHVFCISIDICLAKERSDLTDVETKQFWISQIRKGHLLGLGGGPPCESWTAARLLDDGPPPLRSGSHPWGLQGLRARQRKQVEIGTILLQLLVDLLIEAALAGLCGFLEHPAYPCWAMPQNPSSIWALEVMSLLSKLQCFEVLTFDQCIFEHVARKPTSLLLLRMRGTAEFIRSLGHAGRCNHQRSRFSEGNRSI